MEVAGRLLLSALRMQRGHAPVDTTTVSVSRLSSSGLSHRRHCAAQDAASQEDSVPLRVWFWAIFLVARHKKSISALQLMTDLGLGSYRTAWLLLHKIRACFDESREYPLLGLVEVDEAYVGGVKKGAMAGRAAGNKGIVVTGVEVLESGRLGSARMKVIPDVKARSLTPFVVENVDPGATVATDGWPGFNEIERLGYRRDRHVSKGPRNAAFRPVLDGVHLMISNLKTWLLGRFHGVSRKYLPAYVAEFMYRFNRRRSPPELFGWVTRRLMTRTALTLGAIQSTADVCA